MKEIKIYNKEGQQLITVTDAHLSLKKTPTTINTWKDNGRLTGVTYVGLGSSSNFIVVDDKLQEAFDSVGIENPFSE